MYGSAPSTHAIALDCSYASWKISEDAETCTRQSQIERRKGVPLVLFLERQTCTKGRTRCPHFWLTMSKDYALLPPNPHSDLVRFCPLQQAGVRDPIPRSRRSYFHKSMMHGLTVSPLLSLRLPYLDSAWPLLPATTLTQVGRPEDVLTRPEATDQEEPHGDSPERCCPDTRPFILICLCSTRSDVGARRFSP